MKAFLLVAVLGISWIILSETGIRDTRLAQQLFGPSKAWAEKRAQAEIIPRVEALLGQQNREVQLLNSLFDRDEQLRKHVIRDLKSRAVLLYQAPDAEVLDAILSVAAHFAQENFENASHERLISLFQQYKAWLNNCFGNIPNLKRVTAHRFIPRVGTEAFAIYRSFYLDAAFPRPTKRSFTKAEREIIFQRLRVLGYPSDAANDIVDRGKKSVRLSYVCDDVVALLAAIENSSQQERLMLFSFFSFLLPRPTSYVPEKDFYLD